MGIGIFGGTFDPVHLGHLRAAEEIRERFNLEKIYFVPVHIPPHKNHQNITDAKTRLNMLKIAIHGNSFFRLSGIEIKRGGVSYSIDTVQSIKKRYKDLSFIIGVDAFSEIHTWHNYKELFNHTHFIVMVPLTEEHMATMDLFPEDIRANIKKVNGSTCEHASGNKIHFHPVTRLDISSTKIRELVQDEKSIRYLVPYKIEKFITLTRLYKK